MDEPLKILLLEDVKYDYDLIVQELESLDLNYKTKLVSDKKGFLEALKTYQPDIILSDYSLPQYDGMSALKHTLKITPKTPFIIVTGSINEEIAVDCIKAGAADYVTKEHLPRLTYAIRGALNQKKILEEKEIAQKKLIESEERYRRLFEDSIDPILVIEDFKFVDCNEATINFLNYKHKSEFLNKAPGELSPDYQPDGELSTKKDLEMMNLAIKNGSHSFEWIHLTKDQKEIWVDVSLTYIPILGKNSIYTIWRNITEQKTAQLTQKVLFNISESAESSNSLEELTEKIHAELGKIIDNTNFYIALYDSEKDLYRLTFYKDKYKDIDTEKELDLKGSITDYVRREGKPIRITNKIEHELNKTNKIRLVGSPSLVWIGAPLINSSTEEIIGVVAIQNYEDENALTDKDVDLLAFVARNMGATIVRKKNEEELKLAKEKAEESDRLKTAFLANMSHEIRTPMNAILGFSELLSIPDLDENERNEFVKLIQNNSNALLNLINDIIDIAKIESGQLQILKNEFSVNKLLENILKTYTEIRNNVNKQHIKLKLNIPDSQNEIFIFSDQNRISQVISNLVGNALKYTEKGIIEFGFNITKGSQQEIIQFHVKDTGIGIPENKMDVIFERFRQGDDSYTREYGGTGLGLAISKNIAKLLGGDIQAESKQGKGSVFYFHLPLKSTLEPQPQKRKEKTVNDTKYLALKDKLILIVEDVESNFQLLETYLKKTNASILWAKNGKEAVNICKTNKNIDLILMDMQMPVMNGYEATQEIKKIRPKLPIIAETAFALAGDREKILKAGCDDYLSKPIKAEILYKKISNFI